MMPVDSIALTQLADMGAMFDYAVRYGFQTVVAAYLLVKTTQVLRDLDASVRHLSGQVDVARHEFERQGEQIRSEVRALTEAMLRKE